MGGLAHYIEAAGIATTQISLVRLHSEKIKPPRALWVPFELGRPFGVPNDAAFQRDVVLNALRLLEAPSGPLLQDYLHDAPDSANQQSAWVCPINLAGKSDDLSDADAIERALNDEIAQFRTWYDRAVAARGRTTFGVSGLELPEIARLFARLLLNEVLPPSPRDDLPLANTLPLAAEDLKAFYLEAASAQPGDASSSELRRWFWSETRAGEALRQLKSRLADSDDKLLKITANVLMVPVAES